MASLSTDKGGNRTIQFRGADGKRRSIRLGKLPESDVMDIRDKISLLEIYARKNRSPDRETAAWLVRLDDKSYDTLAAGGVAEPRPSTKPAKLNRSTLAPFLDSYIAKQADKKRSTIICLTQCRNDLVEFFGVNKPLADVTEGDAEEWRQFLRTRPARPGRQKAPSARASQASFRDRNKPKQPPKRLQENTIRRRCGRARQLFQAAVRHRLIARNPFAELKGVSVLANRSRDYFISRGEADKVLAACPDSEWKLIFALSRYGGLRCPSEHLGLRWGDIDWQHSRIVVRSPKTEHHEGKAQRTLPMFPELRPYLEAVRDELFASGFDPKRTRLSEQPVITRYRDCNANLRTQLQRIICNAGLTSWPKLFQNLRSTRETELAERFPIHVVCEWIGNSQAVAAKHYLQVTADHYAQAAEVVQNPVPSYPVASTQHDVTTVEPHAITGDYELLRLQTSCTVAEAGVEPARGLPLNGF